MLRNSSRLLGTAGLLLLLTGTALGQTPGPPPSLGGAPCTGAFCAATTPLGAALGGTGVDNTGRTITLTGSSLSFTPTMTAGTPGDLTVVYSTPLGWYVQVGPAVIFYISMTFTPTFTTASGSVFINTGLPANNSSGASIANVIFSGSPIPTYPTGTTELVANFGLSTTQIAIIGKGTLTSANLAMSNLVSGQPYAIRISGTYMTGAP